jgi:hypothetical protein
MSSEGNVKLPQCCAAARQDMASLLPLPPRQVHSFDEQTFMYESPDESPRIRRHIDYDSRSYWNAIEAIKQDVKVKKSFVTKSPEVGAKSREKLTSNDNLLTMFNLKCKEKEYPSPQFGKWLTSEDVDSYASASTADSDSDSDSDIRYD